MKCEDYRTLFPEYWEGGLEEEDRAALEMHLASCPACRAEADSLARIWHGLERIPQASPSRDLRRRFYEKLEAYQFGLAESETARPKSGFWETVKAWWSKPALQIGFSAAMLAIGFGAGYRVDDRRDNSQLSQLRSEVGNMRQLVTLSLLQQQNATDRLRGVTWAYHVEESDTQVLSALLHTINHDSNVNVRLAAVDAIRTFADSPVARRGLVQSIGKQDSPLVQIALIDMLAELKDSSATPALESLARDAKTNSEVRERAAWAVARLR
jgi:hypothetical protein